MDEQHQVDGHTQLAFGIEQVQDVVLSYKRLTLALRTRIKVNLLRKTVPAASRPEELKTTTLPAYPSKRAAIYELLALSY